MCDLMMSVCAPTKGDFFQCVFSSTSYNYLSFTTLEFVTLLNIHSDSDVGCLDPP